MQTDFSAPLLSDFLDPAEIEVRAAGAGWEDGTAIVWLKDTWTGASNPATVRSGVSLRGYLEGDDIGRTAIEGATDLDEPGVQAALTGMRLHLIAAHGQQYLAPVQDEIDRIGDPQLQIAKDERLREAIRQRVADGTADPETVTLVATADAQEKELAALRRRYAVLLWRYLAHLYRHGMAVEGIARWAQQPAATVQRRISSVPTAGAAAITGVEPKTWSAYVARGQAPAPDDYVGREPVWRLATVLRHIDTRPGRPGRPSKDAHPQDEGAYPQDLLEAAERAARQQRIPRAEWLRRAAERALPYATFDREDSIAPALAELGGWLDETREEALDAEAPRNEREFRAAGYGECLTVVRDVLSTALDGIDRHAAAEAYKAAASADPTQTAELGAVWGRAMGTELAAGILHGLLRALPHNADDVRFRASLDDPEQNLD